MESEEKIPITEYIEAEYKKLESIGWIDTPLDVILNARAAFIFNFLLADAIGHNLITPASFRAEIPVHTGGVGLTVRKQLTENDLAAARWNNVALGLAASAIASDKALDATFGDKMPEDSGTQGSARAIIYQVRNAFAHDLLNPTWLIKPKYRRVYEVEVEATDVSGKKLPLTIKFNGAALHGQLLKPEHFGGLEGYAMLLEHCIGMISANPRGKVKYTPKEDE